MKEIRLISGGAEGIRTTGLMNAMPIFINYLILCSDVTSCEMLNFKGFYKSRT